MLEKNRYPFAGSSGRFISSRHCSWAAALLFLWVWTAAVVSGQVPSGTSLSDGDGGRVVSLAEAQALALEGNATLRAQRLTLEAARRSSQARWNSFLPGINLGGSVSNSHTIVDGSSGSGAGTSAAGGNANWSWGLSGGVSLSLTAGIPVQMQLAALGYEIAQTNYQLQLQTVMANVASSFYNLVAEAKNLSVLEDNLELTRSQYELARRNYNRGLASELDMLRSQYAYVSAQPELEKAQFKYQSNLAAFQILVGSPTLVVPTEEFQLVQLQLPDTQQLVQDYREGRLDVMQKRQALRQSQLSKTSQNLAARAPSVGLSESLRFSPPGERDDGPSVMGSFSVSVSIPVDGFIPGSSKSLSLKQAADAVTTAQLNLDTTLAQARQDIETKVAEVAQLWHAIDIARLNESIAERSYQLSQEGYRAGLVSQTDLETSRQQMVSAQLAASNSQSQYLVGVGNLANALGLELEQLYQLFGVQE